MKLLKNKWIRVILIIILTLVFIVLYGKFVTTQRISINEYTIKDNNISTNFDGVSIIHISDIHYKTTIDFKQLNKVTRKVNSLKPDIIVISGDLLDSSINYSNKDYEELSNFLSSMKSTLGKYIIAGDNDNLEKFNSIIINTDFIDLNNKIDTIYNDIDNPILIAGMSSNYNDFSSNKLNDIYNYINTSNIKYKILVMHEPDFVSKIKYNKFNLILAGHSMGGSINIPIIKNVFLPKYSKKYVKKYYKINNTKLFINNGIGTNKLKYRLFNNPSINVYRLKNIK